MTKLEYDTITILLKEQEQYQEVLRGFKEAPKHYIISKYIDNSECTRYQLDSDEESIIMSFFEKQLKQIEQELKELGYYD